jgi:hypothetical protein
VTEDLLARGGATGRLHALDTARAAMMLLGLVLHAAASYITTTLVIGTLLNGRRRMSPTEEGAPA